MLELHGRSWRANAESWFIFPAIMAKMSGKKWLQSGKQKSAQAPPHAVVDVKAAKAHRLHGKEILGI
jgi:hypothetical protein